jgi:hypothetical protein
MTVILFRWFVQPILRWQGKRRWKNTAYREAAYAEMALLAAVYARAASRGEGFKEDAKLLIALSRILSDLSKTETTWGAAQLLEMIRIK